MFFVRDVFSANESVLRYRPKTEQILHRNLFFNDQFFFQIRIIEVNGKLTLATSRDELNRLLAVCPSKTELVVCRSWMPASQPADDFLRRENLRLTHRISYLEDQVADLLNFKEKTLTPQVRRRQKLREAFLVNLVFPFSRFLLVFFYHFFFPFL